MMSDLAIRPGTKGKFVTEDDGYAFPAEVIDVMYRIAANGEIIDVHEDAFIPDAAIAHPRPEVVAAWAHRYDPQNVISDRNKKEMERYEGMCGVAASAWDIPLYAHPRPPAPQGFKVIGYVHPAVLDSGALLLGIKISPMRLSDAQVPVYIAAPESGGG
jgi:hypothetical protein